MKTISDYLKDFTDKQRKDSKDEELNIFPNEGKLIFRGQSKYYWGIESSAKRRLKEAKKVLQNESVEYHINLIENARRFGYDGHTFTSKDSDLEILANIQHFGGATCLTDFSTNFLIALWMACEDARMTKDDIEKYKIEKKDISEYANGKIIWLDLGNDVNFNNISYYNKHKEGDSIQHLLEKTAQKFDLKDSVNPRFWMWEPFKVNNRSIKQDSIFLFGLSDFPTKPKDEKARLFFNEIVIDHNDKAYLRAELDSIFGIRTETVYFDIYGYSYNANSCNKPISEKLLSSKNCLHVAKENIKEEKYSIGLNQIENALLCSSKEDNVCAKNHKLKCNNSKGELLYWKGEILNETERDDEALLCFKESSLNLEEERKDKPNDILLFKYLCEVYRELSILYYSSGNYNEALFVDTKLYNLYKEKGNGESNGVDGLFGIIELSIFLFDSEKYKTYLGYSFELENISILGIILRKFLEILGSVIFENKVQMTESEISKILVDFDELKKENINSKLIGYYLWSYPDTIEWIKKVKSGEFIFPSEFDIKYVNKKRKVLEKNEVYINLLVQKALEMQTMWVKKTFSIK